MVKNIISIFIIIVAIIAVVVNFTGDKQVQENKKDASTAATNQATADKASSNVTYVAPDFELTTLNGDVVRLSDLQGKKVILNFWATWCPPCKAEMPHMQKIYEKYKNQGVEILAVNLTNQDEGEDKIASFVKERGLTFKILLDKDGTVGQKYKAFTIPTSYMIDADGNIVDTVVGPMDETMMEALIQKAK